MTALLIVVLFFACCTVAMWRIVVLDGRARTKRDRERRGLV